MAGIKISNLPVAFTSDLDGSDVLPIVDANTTKKLTLDNFSSFLLNNYGSTSFRNKIINGDMRIDQRNAGSSVSIMGGTFPSAYVVDRWKVSNQWGSQSVPLRAEQVDITGDDPTGQFPYALRITGRPIGTTLPGYVAGNELAQINQYIESEVCKPLIGKQMVLSARIRANGNFTVNWIVLWAGAGENTWVGADPGNPLTDQSFATGNFAATTTPTTFTSPSFTVPTEARNGIRVVLQIGVGFNSTSQYVDITGVQFELGTVATAFEHRPLGTELALCQRYYEKSYNIDVAPGYAFGATGTGYANSFAVVGYGGTGQGGTAGNNTTPTSRLTFQDVYANMVQPFKVTKRTEPAMKAYSTFTGAINSFTLTQTYNSITSHYTYVYGTVKSGYTVPFGIYANNNMLNFNGGYQYTPNGQQFNCSFQWTADAEL
jgi:hypothetical protein